MEEERETKVTDAIQDTTTWDFTVIVGGYQTEKHLIAEMIAIHRLGNIIALWIGPFHIFTDASLVLATN